MPVKRHLYQLITVSLATLIGGLAGIYLYLALVYPTEMVYQASPRLTYQPFAVAISTTATSTVATSTPRRPLVVPAPLVPHQENKIKILVLGTDQRVDDKLARTDVLFLVVIDQPKKQVRLLSLPRDLYVVLPGGVLGRINRAYQLGGLVGVEQTLKLNFGLTADYSILTNFSGLTDLIDTLGGITVIAGKDFADWRAGEWTEISAGKNKFDGATALWYLRSRETSNDLDRNRRTQEVFSGILLTLLDPNNLARVGEIYQGVNNSFQTDLASADLPALVLAATQLGTAPIIRKYTLSTSEVSYWVEPESGAQVLLPDQVAIATIARRVIGE
jgi:LCP family protein required for cell wall assembly